MSNSYKCPICGNTDERFIGYRNGSPYCRKCIGFSGFHVHDSGIRSKFVSLSLSYMLSKEQERISQEVLENIKNHKNVLIYAVTGAGKTELVYKTMEYVIQHGGNVGFAIPRRDVVIDLTPRIKDAFKDANVIAVYGGNSKRLEGDIIVLTTHQLYRYEKFFDLLIVDEIDAFPFKDNDLLNTFLKKSIKGNFIYLSATPTEKDKKDIIKNNGVVLELFKRYHNHPLPVPKYIKPEISAYFTCAKLLKNFVNSHKQVFLFVPTINIGISLFRFLKYQIKGGVLVHSEEPKRDEYIKQFKEKKLNYLVTTSILERGVTVENLQVIVFNADHKLYTKETLIQIAGRVGRKTTAPEGEVIFIGEYQSENIKECIREISAINKKAYL